MSSIFELIKLFAVAPILRSDTRTVIAFDPCFIKIIENVSFGLDKNENFICNKKNMENVLLNTNASVKLCLTQFKSIFNLIAV